MFKVYFSNFGYFSDRIFETFEGALAYAKSVHFECSIHSGDAIAASWSPLYGLRTYRP
jgi:hypothetical protein